MPEKVIGYTFPDHADYLPYRDVVTYGNSYLDFITVYRANQDKVDLLEQRGVPRSKIIWGLAIGCNTVDGEYQRYADVPLEDAKDAASRVRIGGYAGVTTWSLNRDTNHRFLAEGGCSTLQTGEQDGAFINTIFEELGK